MKLPDPDIQTGPWETVKDGVQRNLDALAKATVGTGGVQSEFRTGTATLVFTASTIAAVGAIAHGLGRAPVHVSLNTKNVTSFSEIASLEWHNAGATTFDINALVPAAITASVTVTWMAIG